MAQSPAARVVPAQRHLRQGPDRCFHGADASQPGSWQALLHANRPARDALPKTTPAKGETRGPTPPFSALPESNVASEAHCATTTHMTRRATRDPQPQTAAEDWSYDASDALVAPSPQGDDRLCPSEQQQVVRHAATMAPDTTLPGDRTRQLFENKRQTSAPASNPYAHNCPCSQGSSLWQNGEPHRYCQ
jgi:hypothetical protein